MTLTGIVIFLVGALLYNTILPAKWRGWALFAGSVLAIYWLQPAIAVRPMDFVLPTATLALAVGGWLLTRADNTPEGDLRSNLPALGAAGGMVLLLAVVGGAVDILPSPPPPVLDVAFALAGVGVAFVVIRPLVFPDRNRDNAEASAAIAPDTLRNRTIWVYILLIIAIFAILKAEPLAVGLAGWLRAQAGRPLTLAGVIDVGWLGFSYVAFRLIHTLRDRQTGKLPPLTLREYLTYLIFFPAYTAGPIDRAERFVKDFRALPSLASQASAPRAVEASGRIMMGIFKKFVIADSLALFSLNVALVSQAQSAGGLWLLLYAFAFRLYFDFSGYSDIAIGIGKLYGINLPENFSQPYLKSNITVFWQSWHMTLSTWARLYVFTPLSRVLLTREPKPSPTLVVLLTQMATMITIGLWHGITANFVIWGIWHGFGLFVHKMYSDRTRMFYQGLKERPGLSRAIYWGGVLLTFHFVVLGWVWFALPDPALSLRVLLGLVGMRL